MAKNEGYSNWAVTRANLGECSGQSFGKSRRFWLNSVALPKMTSFAGAPPSELQSPFNFLHVQVMQVKPMKPWISNMFRMNKTRDVITLFHKPSLSASTRIANLLKQASANASESATEDQASDHSHQHQTREPFELEITEADPTPDQLKNIFDYVGAGKAAELVKGASSQSDALRKLKENGESFQRPVVVDWAQGKAVVGAHESEILKLVKEIPKLS